MMRLAPCTLGSYAPQCTSHFFKLRTTPLSRFPFERVYSVMKFIKIKLRNKISDEFVNDTVITYVDIDLF